MKAQKDNRRITPTTKQQWKIYQALGAFATELDRLPDIQEVRNEQPRSAPQALLPMVF